MEAAFPAHLVEVEVEAGGAARLTREEGVLQVGVAMGTVPTTTRLCVLQLGGPVTWASPFWQTELVPLRLRRPLRPKTFVLILSKL